MGYFDNAATTYPKPECVYKFMDEFYRNNGGSAGRGNHTRAITSSKLISETRKLLQDILHCPNKQVVFTPSATIALNIVLQGLIKAGKKNVYISPFEHNAVTRTLHSFKEAGIINIEKLSVDQDLSFNMDKIKDQFDRMKPDLVIVSHASNVIGIVAPIEEIFYLAKQYKAITVVDMAQTAGLVDCNVALETIDFAIFAGHKTLYGPTGISGFVMKPEIKLPSVIFGGTGFESLRQDMPDSLPERFEMGTTNIAGVAGLYAALKWIKDQGVENLYKTEIEHRKKLLNLLEEYSFVKIVGNVSDRQYIGIVSVLIEDIPSDSAGGIFDECGIAVRTGLQCAPLAHEFLGTNPVGTIRLSTSAFTNDEDFEQLRKALDYIDENID